jgi:hypothetical protein
VIFPTPDGTATGGTLAIVARPIVRLRQAPHLSDENRRMAYHLFQLDLETGIGLPVGLATDRAGLLTEQGFALLAEDGSALLLESSGTATVGLDPVVYLQWSDTYGKTWSQHYPQSAGRLGRRRTRVIWRRLGQGRTRLFRVLMSDPVDWVLMDGFIELTPGLGR